MTGTYVALKQQWASARGLYDRLRIIGLEELGEPENFHTTIAFSRKVFPAEQIVFPDEPIEALIKSWTIFKARQDLEDSEDCLVALLEVDKFQPYHDQAMALGASHEYESFNPHITVSYKYRKKISLSRLPVDYLVRFEPIPTIEPLIL